MKELTSQTQALESFETALQVVRLELDYLIELAGSAYADSRLKAAAFIVKAVTNGDRWLIDLFHDAMPVLKTWQNIFTKQVKYSSLRKLDQYLEVEVADKPEQPKPMCDVKLLEPYKQDMDYFVPTVILANGTVGVNTNTVYNLKSTEELALKIGLVEVAVKVGKVLFDFKRFISAVQKAKPDMSLEEILEPYKGKFILLH